MLQLKKDKKLKSETNCLVKMTFLPLLFSAESGAAPRLSPPCLTPALCGQSSQEPCWVCSEAVRGSAAWAADEDARRSERHHPEAAAQPMPEWSQGFLSTRTATQSNCKMGTRISLWLKNITDDHILKPFLRIWLYWLRWWKERLQVELHMGGQINNWLKTW